MENRREVPDLSPSGRSGLHATARPAPAVRVAVGLTATASLVLTGCVYRAEPPPADEPAPITYFIADGAPESGFRTSDRTLAEWALQAWADQSQPALELAAAGEGVADLRVHWVRADEGLYGEARVRVVDGRTVADVYIRPQLAGLGTDIEEAGRADPLFRDTVVYLTCVHEIGHAFGLVHTSDYADIMYSFQYGGDFVAYFDRFRSQLRTWEDIRSADPFSAADREAFRTREGTGGD